MKSAERGDASIAMQTSTSMLAASHSIQTDHSEKIRGELVRLVYTQSFSGLWATYPMIFFVVFMLWSNVDTWQLLAWGVTAFLINTYRVSFGRSFLKNPPPETELPDCEKRFFRWAFIGGAIWGLSIILLVQFDSIAHHVFLTLSVAGGMAGGALSTLSPIINIYRIYTISAVGPFIIFMLSRGNEISIVLGAMLSVLLLLFLRTARNLHESYIGSFKLIFENVELVKILTAAKADVEKVNCDLQEEIHERQREAEARQKREQRLKAQQTTLLELARYEASNQGDLEGLLQVITQSAAKTMEVARVGVWLYENNGEVLRCIATYPAQDITSPSYTLKRSDYPGYFTAVEKNLIIAVEDANIDTRTLEFKDNYLSTYNIRSLLDAPIRLSGRPAGVLCHEQVGETREWSLEDQNFAATLAEIVALSLDQHQRQQVEEALFQEKERAQITVESIGDGVITTDVNGFIEYLNPVAVELTGWPLDEAQGKHLNQVLKLMDEKLREPITQVYERSLQLHNYPALPEEILLTERIATLEYSIELTASLIRDRADKAIGAVMVLHDITALRKMARQMSHQASHDPLTGLINRREFEVLIENALVSAQKDDKQHALMYLDLDRFKIVNDTCGHLAGDQLLRNITMLLHENVRESDALARLGGDEFGVLLHGCSLENARTVAEKMRMTVHDFRFGWQEQNFDVGVSIGIVSISAENRDLVEVLSAADAACYVAKDTGRNRIHVYMPDDAAIAQRHGEMQWLHRIKRALAENRFQLYYQPVRPVNKEINTEVYCEFLVRMLDEQGNLVPPMAFIPAAERYQQMPAVDSWVVKTLLQAIADDHPTLRDFDIYAVNLSGQTLCDENFFDFVLLQLADQRVQPEKICFEITETAAIANLPQAIQFITKLRDMGCRFALDDFGSGLSSFAYLKSLDVDFLKIDGSFVKDMAQDPIDYAMVEAVNKIGHVMNKKTIAEFVENTAILTKLEELGVDYAQGYSIARPAPLEIKQINCEPTRIGNAKR